MAAASSLLSSAGRYYQFSAGRCRGRGRVRDGLWTTAAGQFDAFDGLVDSVTKRLTKPLVETSEKLD